MDIVTGDEGVRDQGLGIRE